MNEAVKARLELFIQQHPEQVEHVGVILEMLKKLNIELGEIDVGQ